MTAERLMMIGGILAFTLTFLRVLRRRLSERHALPWLVIATGLLILGLFPGLIMSFADASGLSYPSAVLFIALSLIYLFSMHVSLALTQQKRTTHRLLQEVAILRCELEEVRECLASQDTARQRQAEARNASQIDQFAGCADA